ncbi:MAG: galactose mutarotase [Bacteroidales bacterium]|nr:galactose mutarotase [Bacteroidales bacterium]
MKKEDFSQTIDGKQVHLYTLETSKGTQIDITNYGGIVVNMKVPDKNNKLTDILLGYDSLDGYINGCPYFGAIIGRCANRIRKAKFNLNGTQYQLSQNDGDNHLHGGIKSFSHVVWDVVSYSKNQIKLSYISGAGEEGYPGTLRLTATYSLTEQNEFKVEILASTTQTTPVNITTHPFFNLNGEGNANILEQIIKINADNYTPVTSEMLPNGDIETVINSPFDFREYKAIGRDIDKENTQLEYGNGYDHNYILNKDSQNNISFAASAYSKVTGIKLDIYTNQPGIQLYTGNWLDGADIGKSKKAYVKHSAFCMEPQFYPDSPNNLHFPSIFLEPLKTYQHITNYKLSIIKT